MVSEAVTSLGPQSLRSRFYLERGKSFSSRTATWISRSEQRPERHPVPTAEREPLASCRPPVTKPDSAIVRLNKQNRMPAGLELQMNDEHIFLDQHDPNTAWTLLMPISFITGLKFKLKQISCILSTKLILELS